MRDGDNIVGMVMVLMGLGTKYFNVSSSNIQYISNTRKEYCTF